MIPSLVAGEIREALLDYLKTTWAARGDPCGAECWS